MLRTAVAETQAQPPRW